MSTQGFMFTSGSADLLHTDSARRLSIVPAGQLVTWEAVNTFIWAGNATFTLVSLKTGMRYTYRLKVKKEDIDAKREGADLTFFLSLLRGPDNTSDYAYMGVVRKPGRFFITSASKMGRTAPAVQAFVWFIECLRVQRAGILGAQLAFWHEGKCGRCGRKLTVPESVSSGLGPVCDGRMM